MRLCRWASRLIFWKQAIDTLRNIKTHKLLLMAEGTRSDHFASGFNYTFGFPFYDQMKTVFNANQPVTKIDYLNASEYAGAGEGNMVVRYITNHDVNSSDGSPIGLFGGSSGSMAAFGSSVYEGSANDIQRSGKWVQAIRCP